MHGIRCGGWRCRWHHQHTKFAYTNIDGWWIRIQSPERNQYKILYVSLTWRMPDILDCIVLFSRLRENASTRFWFYLIGFWGVAFFYDYRTLLGTNAIAVHQITNRYCLHLCTKICVIFETFLSFFPRKILGWNGFVFKKKKEDQVDVKVAIRILFV